MEVKAIYKYARISPLKAREVTRAITGMDVSQALAVLNYTPKKAALLIGKTLQSAIANATHNAEMDEETLFIKSCVATDGPALKRIMPRARGSASPIKKRMTHITVVLDSRAEPEAKVEAPAKKKAAPVKAESEAPAKPKRTRAKKDSE
jgi:large subunit ribosomal protein L22